MFYRPGFSVEVDRDFDLAVVDLVDAMRPFWHGPSACPGEPYVHDEFRKRYSDHCPVVFRMRVPERDDD